MTARTHDWTATRRAYAWPCIGLLIGLAGVQIAWSVGHASGRVAAGLAYALVCLGAIWVLLERAELVRNTEPLRWKILTWAVCGAAAFAMVGHLLFGSKLEQAVLGGGCAIVAVMTLFIAFSPDDADMLDNEQMTRPSDPLF